MDAIKDQPNVWTDRPNDNEYAAFEEYIRELAEELDMTPSSTSKLMDGCSRQNRRRSI